MLQRGMQDDLRGFGHGAAPARPEEDFRLGGAS